MKSEQPEKEPEFTDLEKALYLLNVFVKKGKDRRAIEQAYGCPPEYGQDLTVINAATHFLSEPHILEQLKSVIERAEKEPETSNEPESEISCSE